MLTELENQYLIGYVCISSSKFSSNDIEEIRTTKAYTELLRAIEALDLHISEHEIVADVLAAPNRRRWQLEAAIETFRDGKYRFFSPKGVLVIHDLAALGTKKDIVQKNYLLLIRSDVGILMLDPVNEDFSTVEPDLDNGSNGKLDTYHYIHSEPMEREALVEKISDDDIKTKRGANKSHKEITDEFKDIYWLYENYYIPERILFNSGIPGTANRVTFNRYASEYEHTEAYPYDEDAHSDVWEKPKRHGTTPKNLAFYLDQLYQNKMSTEEVCRKLRMTPKTLHRYELKGYDRSAMTKATYEYRDDDIIRQTIEKYNIQLPQDD